MVQIRILFLCLCGLLFSCSSTDSGPGDAGISQDLGPTPTDTVVQDQGSVKDAEAPVDAPIALDSTNDEGSSASDVPPEEDAALDVPAVAELPIKDEGAVIDQGTSVDTPLDPGAIEDTNAPLDAFVETNPAPSWFQSFGGSGNEEVKAVTADSQGNVYVTGIFQNTITIGDETFEHSEPGTFKTDFFVASYGPDGAFRWAKAFGAEGNDNTFEIAIDGQDQVYVAGFHHANLSLGSTTLEVKGDNDADIFVVSFDMEGNQLWAKNWGGPYGESPRDLSVNPAGDIFITGSYQGSMTADDFTVTTDVEFGGVSEIFVLAVDGESHEALWLTTFTGIGHDVGTSLEADDTRNVVLGISYQYDITVSDDITFDTGGTNFSVGLLRLDSMGDLVFAKDFGGSGSEEIIGLDMGSLGEAYFTGVFSDVVNFGGDDLVGTEGHDMMLVAYAANGDHLWSVAYTGASFDQALDLEVKGQGIYVTGRFNKDLNFGDFSLNKPEDYDIFLGRFSTLDGSPIWVEAIGGADNDQGNGIGLAGDGGIYVGGYHKGPVAIGTETSQPAATGNDNFVFRYTE